MTRMIQSRSKTIWHFRAQLNYAINDQLFELLLTKSRKLILNLIFSRLNPLFT